MPRGKIQLPSSLTDESRADLTPSLLFEAVAARQGLVCCDPGVLLPGSQQVNKNPLRVLSVFAVQFVLRLFNRQ